MFRTSITAAVTAAAALALAPAPASADAVCTIQFDLAFDESGRFSQVGSGEGVCAGRVAGVALDPAGAAAAISGVARSSGNACAPLLDAGDLHLRPRRMLEFWGTEYLEMSGDWRMLSSSAAGGLTGTVFADGTATPFVGEMRFVADGSHCPAAGFVPGRLNLELLLGREQPGRRYGTSSQSQSEPAQPAAKSKPKARKRRSCRRAGSRKAVKRCRRARAQRRK